MRRYICETFVTQMQMIYQMAALSSSTEFKFPKKDRVKDSEKLSCELLSENKEEKMKRISNDSASFASRIASCGEEVLVSLIPSSTLSEGISQ